MIHYSELKKAVEEERFLDALDLVYQKAQDGHPPLLIASAFSIIIRLARTRLNSGSSLNLKKICPFCSFTDHHSLMPTAKSIEGLENQAPRHDIDGPIFTIIMPTYNRYPLFLHSIYSASIQYAASNEIIIVDDCSSDDTLLFLEYLSSFIPNIRYLKSERNCGAAEARNNGAKKSHGKFLAFLDSDNIWKYDYLSTALPLIVNAPHIYRRYIDASVAQDGQPISSNVMGQSFNYEKLTQRNYIDLNAYIIRRDYFFLSGCFEFNLKRRQDWQFVLRSSWSCPPLYDSSDPKVYYRRCDDWDQISILQKDEKDSAYIVTNTIKTMYSTFQEVPQKLEDLCVTLDDLNIGAINLNQKRIDLEENISKQTAKLAGRILLIGKISDIANKIALHLVKYAVGYVLKLDSLPFLSDGHPHPTCRGSLFTHGVPVFPIPEKFFNANDCELFLINQMLLVESDTVPPEIKLKDVTLPELQTISSHNIYASQLAGFFDSYSDFGIGVISNGHLLDLISNTDEAMCKELAFANLISTVPEFCIVPGLMAMKIPIFIFSVISNQWLVPINGDLAEANALTHKNISKIVNCNYRFVSRYFSERATINRLSLIES